MFKLKSIFTSVIGNAEQIGAERYFVTITFFVASLFVVLVSSFHWGLGLSRVPVYMGAGVSLMLLGFFFLVRFGKCLFFPKLILTVGGIIALDFVWYTKYLSNGPILLYLFIFGALILWVWEGKALTVLLTFYFLNIAVLYFIEASAPAHLLKYPSDELRPVDIYLSAMLYSGLMIFLLYMVKKDFLRQKAQAIKSDRLKSAFLENMSHEIRTPMNAIVGFSELLGNGGNAEENRQYVRIIQNSGNALLRLIDDVLDLSRIEAGDMVLKYSGVNIRGLFVELKKLSDLELIRRDKNNVKLDFYLPDGDIVVCSDPVRLQQVLSNLLNNAIKFTSRGTITFSCEKKRDELVFSVCDTGTGIPKEDQKKIFQRFTRFNYLGLNTDGTGIGLSIVEKIVAIFNGRLWLKSVFGEGTTFYFSIPFVNVETHDGASLQKDTIVPPQ